MFIVVTEMEGHAPFLEIIADEKDARIFFEQVELNKWSQGVHLYNGSTGKAMRSRWKIDSDPDYIVEYNADGSPVR